MRKRLKKGSVKKNNKIYLRLITILSIVVPLLVAALILFPQTFKLDLGINRGTLPAFHAIINGTTAVLLMVGLALIRLKKYAAHKAVMLSAFSLSAIFLLSYVISKLNADEIKFGGDDSIRMLYFFVLITHIILSIAVLPLAMLAIFRGLTNDVAKHKRIVRWTFPIWLYVAITGVLVYLFMQPYY